MVSNVILHPTVVAGATTLIKNFAHLDLTTQIILCTLVQIRTAAREDTPLAVNLANILRIVGGMPAQVDRVELDRVKYEVYATLQTIAARERGEDVATYEAWYRDIS